VKPGYKQTEVGVIPEEWDVRTIGDMFRLINGCAFKPDDWKPSGTPIIRIQNLNDPSAEFNYSQHQCQNETALRREIYSSLGLEPLVRLSVLACGMDLQES